MAITRLVEQVKIQHRTHPTRILVKRNRKGKFSYSVLVSRKEMTKMDILEIVEKIWKAVKRIKQFLHIVLKPNQRGGTIHEIISSKKTLI